MNERMRPSARREGLAALGLTALLACEWAAPDEFTPPAPYRPAHVPRPIAPADPGAEPNLLQEYTVRAPVDPQEAEAWELPFQSKRLVVALLIAAAHDRLEELSYVLTPDATWGLPDRRRRGARPIFGEDHGAAFLQALRSAAVRFSARKHPWSSPPTADGPNQQVRSGAEPFWTYYAADGDVMAFREVMYRGRARIDYVGLFESLPPPPMVGAPHDPPPPPSPPPRKPRPGELTASELAGDFDAPAVGELR